MMKCSKKEEKNPIGEQSNLVEKSLNEILREGAERLLRVALQSEIEEQIIKYESLKNAERNQRIVRNGYHKEREIIRVW